MKLNLPTELHSRRQLADCQQELEDLFEYAKQQEFKQKTTKLSEAKKQFTLPELSRDLRLLLQANRKLWQEQGLGGIHQALEGLLKQAPVFDVYLPTAASDNLLQQLAEWFRSNISDQSLLNTKIRRTLAGGFMLRTRNHMYDFSFRSKLLDQRGALAKVLNRLEY